MLKRYRRKRRLRQLKEINNPVIGIAMQCLDRPTDLKDEFSLRLKLDLDNLHAHAEAACIAENFDRICPIGVVSKKDIAPFNTCLKIRSCKFLLAFNACK